MVSTLEINQGPFQSFGSESVVHFGCPYRFIVSFKKKT